MRKTKKDYYGNLNEKDVIDNKKFWKTVKPLFSDKVKTSERISLVHEDKIITMMFFAYVDVCGCFQWSFSRRMRIWSYEIGLYAAAIHCIKSVQIRSFFWTVFSRIRTEYGEILLHIQSEYGKIRTRKNSVFRHFSCSVQL